ncbi:MAG TPA: stage II sporulation protein M, partial [Acidimicrobiales bacterium]
MDIDRFVATNQPTWDRLAMLTKRAGGGLGRMQAAEIDEFVRLYQRASTHLSYARTYYNDLPLVARLTGLVATANAIVYGTRPRSFRTLANFFTTTFPAALWHSRRFIAISAALFFVPAIVVTVWLANSTEAIDALGPPALREAYLEEDFEAYYSSEPASSFAAKVTTNNIQVGFLAFAVGIAACIPTAFVLAFN